MHRSAHTIRKALSSKSCQARGHINSGSGQPRDRTCGTMAVYNLAGQSANQCSLRCRYYQFLLYLTLCLFVIHVFLPPISGSPAYISLLGYVGLAVEATLPLPQIFKNHQARSCKGFRLSVIINWLLGDMMKMSYFFFSTEVIPWAFRLCGIFQMACDLYLGLQFYMYGDKSGVSSISGMGMEMSQKSGRVR